MLLLAVLAARPFIERPAGLAGDVVVVIDTSASMAADDVPPSRLAEAKNKVLEALHDLPANGTVSVIAAGKTARVVVNGTTDLGRVRAAIDGITVSPSIGDLGDALNLANALAARAGDADILVATDAALAIKPTTHVDHEVRVIQVGRERRNQAIVALAVRPGSSGVTRSVFISIANLDIEPAQRRVELYADGILVDAKDLATLDPQTRTEVIVDDVPRGAAVIEVRLEPLDRRRRPRRPRARRPRVGGGAAGPAAAGAARRRRRSLSRDGAVVPAQHGAVRRDAGQVRPGHAPGAVRPRRVRGRTPGDPARDPRCSRSRRRRRATSAR